MAKKSYYIASNPTKMAKSRKIVKAVQLELQRLWIHHNISAREMAEKTGLSISTAYSHRKHKTSDPKLSTMLALSKLGGRSMAQILRSYEETVERIPSSTRGRKPTRYSRGTRKVARKIIEAAVAA